MVNFDELNLKYFCNGFEVPYKLKNGTTLNIKPILVKDYPYYENSKKVLEIAKNEIDDINIIKQSYLEFILNLIEVYEELLSDLLTICNLCMGYSKISKGLIKNKQCLLLCNNDGILEHIITPREFDDIINIILNQNDSNYDNRYISPDVKNLMSEFYKAKYNNLRTPTLEEQKAYVTSRTGISIFKLNNMTYRYFRLVYDSCVDGEMYFAQKMIQCSYKYDTKEDIKHPLFEPKKDPYSEIFEDTNVLSSKGISGADKLNAQNAKMMLDK